MGRPSSARSASSTSRGVSGATRSSPRVDSSAGEGRPRRSSVTGTSAGTVRGQGLVQEMEQAPGRGLVLQLQGPPGPVGVALARRHERPEVPSDLALTDRARRAVSGGMPVERPRPGAGRPAPTAPAGGPRRRTDRHRGRAPGCREPVSFRFRWAAPTRTDLRRAHRPPSRGAGSGGTFRGGPWRPKEARGVGTDRANLSDRSTGDGPRWGRPVAWAAEPRSRGESDGPRSAQPRSSDAQPRSFGGQPRSFDRASRPSDDRAGGACWAR